MTIVLWCVAYLAVGAVMIGIVSEKNEPPELSRAVAFMFLWPFLLLVAFVLALRSYGK